MRWRKKPKKKEKEEKKKKDWKKKKIKKRKFNKICKRTTKIEIRRNERKRKIERKYGKT